jgi:hypothetical protein
MQQAYHIAFENVMLERHKIGNEGVGGNAGIERSIRQEAAFLAGDKQSHVPTERRMSQIGG